MIKMAKKMTMFEIISTFFILGVLLFTGYQSCQMTRSINNQIEYNSISIRPWVNLKPKRTLDINEPKKLVLHYKLINYGVTPALRIAPYATLTNIEMKNINDIFTKLKSTDSVFVYLFPNDTIEGTFTIDMKKFTNISFNSQNRKEIINDFNNKSFFVYFTLHYLSEFNDTFSFVSEYEIKAFKMGLENNEIECKFTYLRTY